jgi:phosphoesterase RecJ-like protein
MLPASKRNRILDDILKIVRRGRTFLLSGHDKPDGDTVGCELAFAGLLRTLGKKVRIVNADPVPESLLFLPGARRIRTSSRVKGFFDVAVIFECSGPDRMGNILDLDSQAGVVVNIDHHRHHGRFGDVNLVDPDASSNSEQVFGLFERAGIRMSRREAVALYAGLVTDTGRFQQGNTNPVSHRVAAALLEAGVNVPEVSRRLYGYASPGSVKILSRALGSLRLLAGGRVALMTLMDRDFRRAGAVLEDADDVSGQGILLPSVEVGLFVRPSGEAGRARVSFRGKGRVDLCRVAVDFGGGGHKNAAGCTLAGSVPSVARRVTRAVLSALPK